MTCLTILGVTKILYSSILVLDEKKGKEISNSLRLQSLEMFLETILFCQMQKTTPLGRQIDLV